MRFTLSDGAASIYYFYFAGVIALRVSQSPINPSLDYIAGELRGLNIKMHRMLYRMRHRRGPLPSGPLALLHRNAIRMDHAKVFPRV